MISLSILIIHPEGNITNNPNLYAFVQALTQKGCFVTVYSKVYKDKYQHLEITNSELITYESNTKSIIKSSKIILNQRKYNIIIGIDDGIITAHTFAKILQLPLVYLSYEIFFDKEIAVIGNKLDKENKFKSKKICNSIAFAITQDSTRKELLSKEYNIPSNKILQMPVAGNYKETKQLTSYFREKYNIDDDKKILLYMGGIEPYFEKDIIHYSNYLPDNWVLIIHSRYKYNSSCSDIEKKNCFFSYNDSINNIDNITDYLVGVNAGLCLYRTSYDNLYTGDNLKYLGLSSGKISCFLRSGIPIVVDGAFSWKDIVNEYNLGVYIGNCKEIKNIDYIINESMSKSCVSFFLKRLDINNYIDSIFEQLKIHSKKYKYNYILLIVFYFSLYYRAFQKKAEYLFEKLKNPKKMDSSFTKRK